MGWRVLWLLDKISRPPLRVSSKFQLSIYQFLDIFKSLNWYQCEDRYTSFTMTPDQTLTCWRSGETNEERKIGEH